MNPLQKITTRTPAATLSRDLIAEYISYIDRPEKTTRTYLNNLKQFFKWLQAEGIRQPQRTDVIRYRDHLTATRKPNTVKQYLQSVKQFFSWTAAAGYYPDIAANVHAPKVRTDAHKKEALTAADVLNIENNIQASSRLKAEEARTKAKDTAGRIDRATEQGKRLYAMYLLAVTAGLRTIELHRANIRDLETRGGNAYIYVHGKGRAEADHKKPIAREVYEALEDYILTRRAPATPDSPLFVATGNRSGGKRLAATTISTMLKRAMQRAGYDSERLTAHSLRHTAATSVMELTNDNVYLTQTYMRHSNPATTEIYLHRDTEAQESEIAQKLFDHYHSAGNDLTGTHDLNTIIAGMNPKQRRQLARILSAC